MIMVFNMRKTDGLKDESRTRKGERFWTEEIEGKSMPQVEFIAVEKVKIYRSLIMFWTIDRNSIRDEKHA